MAVDAKGLQAAYDRKMNNWKGSESSKAADTANLDYALKKGLWSPNNLPAATSAASSVKTEKNTMVGYDVNQGGKQVYVQPGQYYKGISATPVSNMNDAANAINANQGIDYDNKAMQDGPKTRLEETSALLNEYTNMFAGGKEKPETPSMEKTFADLQKTYDTASLESAMADLNRDEKAVQARKRARKEYEASKPVAMGVISGKQSEIEKQENEELDRIGREKSYLNEQLTSKYNMINTIMTLKQTDYTNAMNSYDKEFNQNVQMINFIRGIQNDQETRESKQKTDALANLQIMSNAITSGTLDYADLPAEQKVQITKNELLAGLPIGFTEALKSKLPKSDIISTTTRTDASGAKYADIVTRDTETGKISVMSQYLGKEKIGGSGGGGLSQQEKDERQLVADFKKRSAEWIAKLGERDGSTYKVDWGTAYDSMRAEFGDNFSSEEIDAALGGGYDNEKKEYWGRAKR